jgi:hypothetical protein
MNIQEEFNFLLRNLSEKNGDNATTDNHVTRLRRALTNVINSFITDFDKISQNNTQNKVHLPPIFTMISLYIEQYTELFIFQGCQHGKIVSLKMNQKTIEQGFFFNNQLNLAKTDF